MLPRVANALKCFDRKASSIFCVYSFYFHVFCCTIENGYFWNMYFFFHVIGNVPLISTHFRCRAIGKCISLKSNHFKCFTFSVRCENISNLRKDIFVKYFRGIPFWKCFCMGNIFCETVFHFLSLVRLYFPTFHNHSPNHS